MALGNKVIDSALRKAIYPTVLFITRMPRRSNNRLFYDKEQSYSHLFASRRLKQYVCPPVELRSVPLKVKASR